jgi:hypothetical protein
VRQPAAHPVEPLLGEAGRADHHVDALIDRPVQVVHHHVGRGEVDEHLSAGVRGVEQPVALVDHRDQLEVVGRVDRLAHLLAHAAAGAEHADPDRLYVSHRITLNGCATSVPPAPRR